MRHQHLADFPRDLLEYMLERARAEQNVELAAKIEEALPKAALYAIDHRDRDVRGHD